LHDYISEQAELESPFGNLHELSGLEVAEKRRSDARKIDLVEGLFILNLLVEQARWLLGVGSSVCHLRAVDPARQECQLHWSE